MASRHPLRTLKLDLTRGLFVADRHETTVAQALAEPRAFSAACPALPGIYVMLSPAGRIIYVGKSKNLRARLKTYLRADDPRDKHRQILRQAERIAWEVIPDEFGCLVREIELIQSLKPRLNVVANPLRRRWTYLCLGPDPAAAFYTSREPPTEALATIGPLPLSRRLSDLVPRLNDLFRLKHCPTEYAKLRATERESAGTRCFRYQLGLCVGPCLNSTPPEAYAHAAAKAARFLAADASEARQVIAERMASAVARLDFEQAATFRDLLGEIDWLAELIASREQARRQFAFIYPVAAPRGIRHWYFISGGSIRAVARFRRKAPPEAIGTLIEQHYFGSGEQAKFEDSETAETRRLVLSWFRQHPEELARVLSPTEALAMCRGAPH